MTASGPEDGGLPLALDGERPVFGEERRQQILDIVNARGRVRVRDLAVLLGVTETTVRKDVIDLHNARLLRRIHGGALAIRPSYEPDVTARRDQNAPGKEAIARACLRQIRDGDAIFIDSGTTTAAIASLLAATNGPRAENGPVPVNVNVLTNAMDVARVLAPVASVRHTVLGGQYRALGGCFVGPLAVSSLETFMLNIAFIGVTGLTDLGLTVADLSEAQVKLAAMNQARRVIVPMDHTKLGASGFARVCGLDRVDMLVTDRDNEHLRRLCVENDVEFLVATS